MSALRELLDGFYLESEINNPNMCEPAYWSFVGDASPKDARVELEKLEEAKSVCQMIVDRVNSGDASIPLFLFQASRKAIEVENEKQS